MVRAPYALRCRITVAEYRDWANVRTELVFINYAYTAVVLLLDVQNWNARDGVESES